MFRLHLRDCDLICFSTYSTTCQSSRLKHLYCSVLALQSCVPSPLARLSVLVSVSKMSNAASPGAGEGGFANTEVNFKFCQEW